MEINPTYFYILMGVGVVVALVGLVRRTPLYIVTLVTMLYEALLYGSVALHYSERVFGVVFFIVLVLAVTAVILPFKGARWFHAWAGDKDRKPRTLLYLALIIVVIAWVLPLEIPQPSEVPQAAVSLGHWLAGAVPDNFYQTLEKARTDEGGAFLVFARPNDGVWASRK